MGIANFLREREYNNGCFNSSRYRRLKRDLNEWLDKLSAAPVLNQPCEFSGEPKATFLVDFSPDGTRIASSHGDHTVRVTEIATGKCTHILTGHPRTPWCLAFHPSHTDILGSGCLGGQVRIWDLRGGGSEVFMSDTNSLIASLTFHPVDNVVVFSTKNMLYFWDWTLPKPFTCCATKHEYECVRWVKFDTFGHYLYTGICNGTDHTGNHYSQRNENNSSRPNSSSSRMNSYPNSQQRSANQLRYMRLLDIGLGRNQSDSSGRQEQQRPTSPVHEDRLRQAFDYARYVTSHSRDNDRWMVQSPGPRSSDGTEQASSSGHPAPHYSMFSRHSSRPQVVANSPPPRPHRDFDSDSDSDSGDENRGLQAQFERLGNRIRLLQGRAGVSFPVGHERSFSLQGVGSQSGDLWPRSPPLGSSSLGTQPLRPSRDSEPSSDPASSPWEPGRPVAPGVSEEAGQGNSDSTDTSQVTVEATTSRGARTNLPCVRQRVRLQFLDSDSNPQQDCGIDSPPRIHGNPWLDTPVAGHSSAGASSASIPLPVTPCARTQTGGDSGEGDVNQESSAQSSRSQLQEAAVGSGQMSCPDTALSGPSDSHSSLPSTEDRGSCLSLNSSSSVSSAQSLRSCSISSSSPFTSAFQSVARTFSQNDSRPGVSRVSEADTPCPVNDCAIPGGSSCVSSINGEASAAGSGACVTASSTCTTATCLSGQSVRTTCASSVAFPLKCSSSEASSTHIAVGISDRKRSFTSAFESSPQPSTSRSVPPGSSSSGDAIAGSSSAAEKNVGGSRFTSSFSQGLDSKYLRSGPGFSTWELSQHGASSSSSRSDDTGWRGDDTHDDSRDDSHSINSNMHGNDIIDDRNDSDDAGDMAGYQPGNLSCMYLYRYQRTLRHRSRRLRAAVNMDINHVRRLAQMSNYTCDFYFAPMGFQQCPICKYTREMPNRPHIRFRREERRQRNLLRNRLMSQMYLEGPGLDSMWGLNERSFRLERTSDSTSQTLGELNEPEHADQGTDMIDMLGLELSSVEDSGNITDEEGVSRLAQPLHRGESNLERQFKNDDEISRIEMRDQGNEILDTLAPVTAQQLRAGDSLQSTLSSVARGNVTATFSASAASAISKTSGLTTSSSTSEPRLQDESSVPSTSLLSQTQEVGPFHTLPSASGSSQQGIEVITGIGVLETISYSELARRVANREDVMVVGNHCRVTDDPQSPSTSGEQRQRHLLRTCLVSSGRDSTQPGPVPPPSSHPSASSTSTASRQSSAPLAPPRILVQRPSNEDQPQGTNQESPNQNPGGQSMPEWRNLHPHYSRSVLDNVFGHSFAMQSSINSAIAGIFMSSGEQAVASNIVPSTYRIQRWDFRQNRIPDLTRDSANIVVNNCKIHNDASIDLSHDSSMISTFIHVHGGFPDENVLGVFSLRKESVGKCLYTKSFGPNAISVSLSPSNSHVLVGLASRRVLFIQTTDQLVGQIFKMVKAGAGENSMKHVTDLYHPVSRPGPLIRGMSPVSLNSARWLPDIGDGIVYGTNHGDLHFFLSGRTRAGVEEEEAKPRTFSISTQTGTGGIHCSTFTQTAEEDVVH